MAISPMPGVRRLIRHSSASREQRQVELHGRPASLSNPNNSHPCSPSPSSLPPSLPPHRLLQPRQPGGHWQAVPLHAEDGVGVEEEGPRTAAARQLLAEEDDLRGEGRAWGEGTMEEEIGPSTSLSKRTIHARQCVSHSVICPHSVHCSMHWITYPRNENGGMHCTMKHPPPFPTPSLLPSSPPPSVPHSLPHSITPFTLES